MTIKYINILKSFFLLDIKRTYFRSYFAIIDFFSIYLTVLIYYYSSKAFTPNLATELNFYGTDLFGFLFWGDLILRIPQSLFYSPISNLKQAITENTFESMVLFSGSTKMIFISLSTMQLLREFASIAMMIFCAKFFFDLNFELTALIKILSILLVFLPLFLSLGLIVSGLVLYFERGENSLSLLSNLMAIFAGMYFPTEVFPSILSNMSHFLSPYTYFLKINRQAIFSGQIDWQNLLTIGIFGIIVLWASLNFVGFILNQKKTAGKSLIIG